MKKKVIFKELVLVLVTLIWGVAFVSQVTGGKKIDPYTFNLSRNIVASIFLLFCVLITTLIKKKKGTYVKDSNIKELLFSGILMGVFLALAMMFQQIGINGEGAGKSGFLTALYVIIVPILEFIFRKKIKIVVLISAFLALIGLYLINFDSGKFSINLSTLFLILCAVCYAFQIMTISRYSSKHDTFMLSFLQFLTASILILPFALVFGDKNIDSIKNALPEILFLGLFSSGIAYTLQIYGQKDVNVTVASIIMSLESVFSLISGVVLLNEEHTLIQYFGCLLIFTSVILAQIDFKKIKR